MDTPSLSMSIQTFMFEKKAQGRAAGTIYDYTVNLDRMCRYLGDKNIAEVTRDDMKSFFYWLRNDYTFVTTRKGIRSGSKGGKERHLSSKTLANAYTAASSFWRWAVDEYDIPNPLKMPRITYRNQPIAPLTQDEIARLLKACDYITQTNHGMEVKHKRQTRLRDRAILMILYDTGVRVSEMCGMRFRDLEIDNNRILVLGKGSKKRYVKVGNVAMQTLWRYVSSRYPKGNPHPDDFIFTIRDNLRQMNRHAVSKLLSSLGERAGVKDVHPHRLRHSFACAYLLNGGDVYSLKDLLGHETLEMVMHYLNLTQSDIDNVHRKASPGDNLFRR